MKNPVGIGIAVATIVLALISLILCYTVEYFKNAQNIAKILVIIATVLSFVGIAFAFSGKTLLGVLWLVFILLLSWIPPFVLREAEETAGPIPLVGCQTAIDEAECIAPYFKYYCKWLNGSCLNDCDNVDFEYESGCRHDSIGRCAWDMNEQVCVPFVPTEHCTTITEEEQCNRHHDIGTWMDSPSEGCFWTGSACVVHS
jgi:hypothetical protein